MAEQLREQFGFEEYENSGGMLDKDTYDELVRAVADMETNPIPVERAFIDRPTGVMITPAEELVYSLLSKGVLGKFFGEQPLRAEAMLVMGDWEKREIYMRGYPQINFRIDLIPRLAPEPVGRAPRIIFRPTETATFAQGL
jgi:hypothetical protein